MNIQIFGKSKCFDTKKAERFFKERGVKFQRIDLPDKGMSKRELESVIRADLAELKGFFEQLETLARQHSLHIILSVTKGEEALPEFMRPYTME